MQYAIVPVEGDITFHEAESIDLDALYKGTKAETVEAIGFERDGEAATAWFDEDYIGRHMDGNTVLNPRADWLVRRFSPGTLIGAPGICGDVVLTGGYDEEGETLGLTQPWVDYLTNERTFEQVHEPA